VRLPRLPSKLSLLRMFGRNTVKPFHLMNKIKKRRKINRQIME